jgi:hypothetical protein
MGRECNDVPGPFNFRGCDLTAEWRPATAQVRVRFPATAPISIKSRTSLCGRVSKTQLAWGSTRATCQFNVMGPWLKSEAPALQAVLSGSVTRRTPPILKMGGYRVLSCFPFFVRLPPPAGGDIQTCQPTAIYSTSINAARKTQIQDLARSLG